MTETERQRLYREEARLLGEIGAILARADMPRVTVRLPATLANAALAAWQRDDEGELDPETYEQSVVRGKAGAFALLGIAVEETGVFEGDEVRVDLDPYVIGRAIDAADDLPT